MMLKSEAISNSSSGVSLRQLTSCIQMGVENHFCFVCTAHNVKLKVQKISMIEITSCAWKCTISNPITNNEIMHVTRVKWQFGWPGCGLSNAQRFYVQWCMHAACHWVHNKNKVLNVPMICVQCVHKMFQYAIPCAKHHQENIWEVISIPSLRLFVHIQHRALVHSTVFSFYCVLLMKCTCKNYAPWSINWCWVLFGLQGKLPELVELLSFFTSWGNGHHMKEHVMEFDPLYKRMLYFSSCSCFFSLTIT